MTVNDMSSSDYLSKYHAWLRLMARLQLDPRWGRKFDASDVAQQTLLEAWKAESQFRGTSEPERIAWLRTILGRVISREVRHYAGTLKRDPSRELDLAASLDRSSIMLAGLLVDNAASPSVDADNREQQMIIAEVLESLPEEYREVIVLRNLKGLSHADVALQLNRTESGVRMLWLRALKHLRKEVMKRQ